MTTRLFVFATTKAAKPTMVLECEKVTKAQATVAAAVSIASVKPGMVCYPGVGRKIDRTTIHVVAETDPKKVGFSIIRFEKEEVPAPTPLMPEPPKP